MMEYKLSFDKLIALCKKPILSDVPKSPGKIKGAFNGGDYLGSPGKDIYLNMRGLDSEQFSDIVNAHAQQYPRKPPKTHVGYAACVRYIYGQFEKQGVLCDEAHYQQMQKEEQDWELPRKFIRLMQDCFEKDKNYYGLSLTFEMEGHRLGDEAVLSKDKDKLKHMEEAYLESVKFAHRCKSYKQMFTPYYWASRYFVMLDIQDRALSYSKRTLFEACKFCPDTRLSYQEKLSDCVVTVKKANRWTPVRKRLKAMNPSDCMKLVLKKHP